MLEGCSLLLFALTLQQFSSVLVKQDSGPAFSLYAMAGLQLSLDLAGVLSWRIGMRDYCSDGECLGSGFNTAIASFTMNVLGTGLVCWFYWHRESYPERLEIPQRKWINIGVVASELLAFVLVLMSIGWPEWVSGPQWSGGLLRCQDCPYQAQRVGWDCFAGVICSSQSRLCSFYSSLRDSGRLVLLI